MASPVVFVSPSSDCSDSPISVSPVIDSVPLTPKSALHSPKIPTSTPIPSPICSNSNLSKNSKSPPSISPKSSKSTIWKLRSEDRLVLSIKSKKDKKILATFTPSSLLTPGVAPQRRRSDQDGSPITSGGGAGKNGKRAAIKPLRASPLFSESPWFGNSPFSSSKTCQALVHSPCRSENYRRQRRRLYHQDEYDDVKRKLSLPDSAGATGMFKTPKLGKGGFGSVYIGKYGGKQVAIKQLHNKKTGQGESLCAELNGFRLHHANIVKVLTFTCTGPFMQIVFEYVGRRNLQQLLDDTAEHFEPCKRVEFCQQIADALNFCHAHRVLHLDVKPANILVTDDSRCCKLADFGCSRIIASVSKSTDPVASCLSASTPGTLMYKAPELLRGGMATPKADVYSFGYVMWQCATRQSPFDGLSMHTIVFCVVAKHLRPTVKKEMMEKATEEESTLIKWAEQCWRPDPASRPDLQDVQEALQEFFTAHVA